MKNRACRQGLSKLLGAIQEFGRSVPDAISKAK
jgi:hypothetical protein